jgi:hypothetical protein
MIMERRFLLIWLGTNCRKGYFEGLEVPRNALLNDDEILLASLGG